MPYRYSPMGSDAWLREYAGARPTCSGMTNCVHFLFRPVQLMRL